MALELPCNWFLFRIDATKIDKDTSIQLGICEHLAKTATEQLRVLYTQTDTGVTIPGDTYHELNLHITGVQFLLKNLSDFSFNKSKDSEPEGEPGTQQSTNNNIQIYNFLQHIHQTTQKSPLILIGIGITPHSQMAAIKNVYTSFKTLIDAIEGTVQLI